MKKQALFFILFLNIYYVNGQYLANCSNTFTFEQTTITDGSNNEIDLVLIELEDVPNRDNLNGWEFRNNNLDDRDGNPFPTPFSGDGYLYYAGSNFFIDGGNNIVEYRINITNPGTYRFIYASAIGIFATDAPPATEHNDAWVKFPDADAFFGYRDNTNTIVIPNNEGVDQNNPDPNDPQLESDYPGATYKVAVNSSRRNNGFFKLYTNQLDDWWYEGSTSDEDPHKVYVRFDSPGTYTMQISGRSDGFALDRAVLYKEEGDFANLNGRNARKNAFKNLSSASPLCLASPSGFDGNKFSSTSVALSWTDNSSDETSFVIEASTQLNFSTILATKTVNADVTQTIFEGLNEGNTYFFRIKATFPSDNFSEYSEVIEVRTNSKPTLEGAIELEVIGDSFLEFPKELFTQSFSDPDGDSIEKLKITSLPEGILNFEVVNEVDPIVVDSEINVNQIETNDGNVQFRYKAIDDFTGKTSFTFTASDGFDFAEVAQTVHITVLKPQIQITLDGNIIDDEQDINFGQVQVGDTSSSTFIIKNTGNLDLSLTSLPLEITNNIEANFVIEQQPIQSVLAADESTELVVKFIPSSAGEIKNAQIVVSNNDYDNGDQDFRIDLFGEGVFIGDPPEIISPSSISISENIAGTVYTAEASENVNFSLGTSNDEALFFITDGANSSEVVLNFIVSPDFETPLDLNQDNEYLVELIVTDTDGNIITQVISITVTDILDETPPQITSSSSTSVEENTSGGIYAATASEQVLFSLGMGKDEEYFDLNNGELSFKEAPDFETPLDNDNDNVYLIDLIATDASGNITTQEISITVTDILDETLLQITSGASTAVEENTSGTIYTAIANKQVSFSLGTDKDEEYFTLNDNELSFKEAPDFESPLDSDNDNVYLIDLIATVIDGTSTLKEVSIIVTDINDTADSGPIFTSASEITASENITGGFYTVETDIPTTLSLGTENDEELFNLTNGELSFKEAPDYESPLDDGGDNIYLVQVIAEDTSGNISSLLLSVTVLDVDDTVLSISSMENELSVYPNPASDKLFIDSGNIDKVMLIDINGNTVFKSDYTLFIDVGNIPSGFYSLIIETAEGIFTKKIIIAR